MGNGKWEKFFVFFLPQAHIKKYCDKERKAINWMYLNAPNKKLRLFRVNRFQMSHDVLVS